MIIGTTASTAVHVQRIHTAPGAMGCLESMPVGVQVLSFQALWQRQLQLSCRQCAREPANGGASEEG